MQSTQQPVQQPVQQPIQQPVPQSIIIMLPSLSIPLPLQPFIADLKDFSVRFINGYRNVLVNGGQESVEWGLVEDEDFCGQAFCYLLKEEVKKEDFMKVEMKGQFVVKEASEQMLVLHVSSQQQQQLATTALPPLSTEQLRQLITLATVTQSPSPTEQKLAINLIKNAFPSYQAYQKSASLSLQKLQEQLQSSQQQTIPTVAETIILEENAKKLHGEMVRKLPKCNNQTGMWDDGETIEIKLVAE